MAARQGNKQWCCQQLQRTLQWDAEAAEAVVEALAAAAGDPQAIEELVEAYMGGNPAACQVVHQFAGFGRGPAGQQAAAAAKPHQPGMQATQRDGKVRQASSSTGAGGSSSGAGGSGLRSGGGGSSRGGASLETMELSPPPEKPQPVLNMGPNIRTTVKPARKKAAPASGAASGDGGGVAVGAGSTGGIISGVGRKLERPVVNCLECGKIYDCRSPADEALKFLTSGGLCTFCGSRVLLRYADGTTNAGLPGGAATAAIAAAVAANDSGALGSASAAPAGASSAGDSAGVEPEGQQGSAAGGIGYNDSAAAAVALKDRLVEYDRQSAKRTTVLDDQSDFFEIDANAWLTDEERVVLKQREREVAEAEEARRKRVIVTFDLLGRKIILDGDASAADGADAAAASDAALAAQLEAARGMAAARAAAAATSAEVALGGGGAAATALAAVQDKLRDLRITVNPSMAAKHFVFLPQQAQQQKRQPRHQQQQQAAPGQAAAASGRQPAGLGASSGSGTAGRAAAAVSSANAQPGSSRSAASGRSASKAQQRLPAGQGFSRLQHDDPFDFDLDFADGPQVLAADGAGRRALELAAQATHASGQLRA